MSVKKTSDTSDGSIVSHLVELRKRLIAGVSAIVVATAILFPFANNLYLWLASPLLKSLNRLDGKMIATQVASPFLAPFKLSLLCGVAVAMPVLLYQLWHFVAPGLYRHERRIAIPLLALSILLFYMGVAFAYFLVFPIMFAFLTASAPEGVQIATDIALYLDFSIKIFFAFGFAFQVPIITILLVLTGTINPQKLANKRPYVVIGAFIIGMLLTPPDVVSQILLALPIWLLFELGLVLGKMFRKHRVPLKDTADEFGEKQDYVEPSDEEIDKLLDKNEEQDK